MTAVQPRIKIRDMKSNKSFIEIIKNFKKNKEYDKGIDFLENLLNDSSEHNIDYYSYLSEFYFLKNNLIKSSELFLKVLEQDPTNFNALLIKAKYLLKVKQYSEALEILISLEQQRQNNYDVQIHTAIAYYKIKDYDNAIYYLNNVINKFPDNNYALYNLALCYIAKKNNDKALEFLNKAYQNSKSEFYYSMLIKLKQKNQQPDNRIAELNKILQIKSKYENPNIHNELGENYLKLKDYKNAAKEFFEAFKLQPENFYYKSRYLYALNKLGEFDIIYEQCPELIRQNVNNIWILGIFTNACKNLNKINEGLEFYFELVKLHPKNKFLYRQIKILKSDAAKNFK